MLFMPTIFHSKAISALYIAPLASIVEMSILCQSNFGSNMYKINIRGVCTINSCSFRS